jgi:peptidoglycan/LPS O-acetylase OafA/YrhL
MTNNQKISDFKNISTFQGLNALRFIAAFLVVMHHSETIKRKNEIENYEWLGLFRNGSNAVTFFFVLSGFLITYLLLKESGKTGDVKIKNFYIKRVLRIWPLYFLLIFIGTIGLPIIFHFFEVPYIILYYFYQV